MLNPSATAAPTAPANPKMRTRCRNDVIHQVPRWRGLTADQKFLRVFENGASVGALAFSLHLSDEVQARAKVHADPAAYIKTRINRVLRDCGLANMAFAFVLEFSKAGRLHCHGIIDADHRDRDLVKLMLQVAGGYMRKHQRARQVKLKIAFGVKGWKRYSLTAQKNTKSALGDRRFAFVSQSMAQTVHLYDHLPWLTRR
jgi:hypothetical protein